MSAIKLNDFFENMNSKSNTLIDAGWSSSVARRAHNPKVAGSNPAPAIHYFLLK